MAPKSATIESSMDNLKRNLWLSQLIPLASLILCTLLMPQFLFTHDEGGVSNFGNHALTVIPYCIGFLGGASFLAVAARDIQHRAIKKPVRLLARTLLVICGLEFLVFISTFPRKFSWTFSEIHNYLGVGQFSVEFLLSVWLVSQIRRRPAFVYLGIEIIGALIALLSVLNVIFYLFVGQVLASIGFGLIVLFVLPAFLKNCHVKKPSHDDP